MKKKHFSLFFIFIALFFFSCSMNNVQSAGDKPEKITMDTQIKKLLETVKGKKVGLVTNTTGVNSNYEFMADILTKNSGCEVKAFFAPEHGLRGDNQAGDKIQDYSDASTGVPCYTIYGVRKAPTDEQLKDIDILIFDIQDVGSRFYTYMWSMTYAMEAAAKNKKKFVVFDRPNPAGGVKVEGTPNLGDFGLIGRLWEGKKFGVATRHGLTVGEMAKYVNGEFLSPKADLEVIEMPGYTRDMEFSETGRPWVLPSPNMPTVDTAIVYPGMCVFEGVNVSEGRGTTKPFEIIGAPYINGVEFAAALNKLNLPGCKFRPAFFSPTFSKYKGEACGGIQVHVTDKEKFEPIRTALFVVKTLLKMYPDKAEVKSNAGRLMGDPEFETKIKTMEVDEIIKSWQPNLDEFSKIREKYLIYPMSKK